MEGTYTEWALEKLKDFPEDIYELEDTWENRGRIVHHIYSKCKLTGVMGFILSTMNGILEGCPVLEKERTRRTNY